MLRRILFLVAISLFALPVLAQEAIHTQAEIAYFKIKNPDGSWTEHRGGTLPITIQVAKSINSDDLTSRINKFNNRVGMNNGGANRAPGIGNNGKQNRGGFNEFGQFSGDNMNTTVYENDFGNNYVTADGPSILDDLTLASSSIGQPWKLVTFGVHFSSTSRAGDILVRWRGYETFTTGLGIGVSAVSDEFFDGGFYVPRSDFPASDETWDVTVDLSLSPLFIVPNLTCFFAQQFREPHPGGPLVEDGEGPFTTEWNVFSDSGPQVGSSDDLFYYDYPPDGVYDETEVDNFGADFPGAGNLRLNIQIGSGTTLDLNPATFDWFRGNHTGGNLGSLWFDDSNHNTGKAGIVLFAGQPPAQLIVETFVASTNLTSLRFDVDSKVNTPGLTQKVEFWNFTTSLWDVIDVSPIPTLDTRKILFAATPTDYVDGTFTLRAKISFYQTGISLLFPWTASVDQVHWIVTTP